jgi:hypothetical protein
MKILNKKMNNGNKIVKNMKIVNKGLQFLENPH